MFSRLMIRPVLAWYDCWIGFYLDTKRDTLYFLPLPMVGFKIRLLPERSWGRDSLCYRCGWTGHHTDLLDGYDKLGLCLGKTHCPDCGWTGILDYSPDIGDVNGLPF